MDPAFAVKPPADFFADADFVDLEAGSVMYHPAGVWHKVEALDDSLSVNISLVGMTWADVAADGIRQLL